MFERFLRWESLPELTVFSLNMLNMILWDFYIVPYTSGESYIGLSIQCSFLIINIKNSPDNLLTGYGVSFR